MEIRSQVEDISSVKKKITVEVPAEEAQREFGKVCLEFQREARIPGFRVGKSPLGLVKSRFAAEIRGEVGRKLVPEGFRLATTQLGLRTVGEPSLDRLDYSEGKPLTFDATIEVLPDINPGKYRGLVIAVPEKQITDEDVVNRLESLRQEFATINPVEERPSQSGDHLVVELVGEFLTAEGQDSGEPQLREEAVGVELGHGDTHPAFTENLCGAMAGDVRVFDVSYEPDYPTKKLAGRSVRFSARVLEVKAKVLPQLDDEFARDIGPFDSLEALKERVRRDLAAAAARDRSAEIRNKLLDKILDETRFELPESLVQAELVEMMQRFAQRLSSGGVDPMKANVNWQKLRTDLLPQAQRSVQVDLLLDEISRREGVVVTAEDLEREIQTISEGNRQPVEKVRQFFRKEGRMESLEASLRQGRAMDIILESAVVS